MADLPDAAIEGARARGEAAWASEPRASGARYDRITGRVVVDLDNGCTFAFPVRLVEGLAEASVDQIDRIEILGRGYGLHWDALDLDISVPGLMAGIFGTKTWMARRAGQARSDAKAAASRMNGAKGGRPPKSASSRP